MIAGWICMVVLKVFKTCYFCKLLIWNEKMPFCPWLYTQKHIMTKYTCVLKNCWNKLIKNQKWNLSFTKVFRLIAVSSLLSNISFNKVFFFLLKQLNVRNNMLRYLVCSETYYLMSTYFVTFKLSYGWIGVVGLIKLPLASLTALNTT